MAAMLGDVIVIRQRPHRAHVHAIHALAMLTMKKELHGFQFLCRHVVLFP